MFFWFAFCVILFIHWAQSNESVSQWLTLCDHMECRFRSWPLPSDMSQWSDLLGFGLCSQPLPLIRQSNSLHNLWSHQCRHFRSDHYWRHWTANCCAHWLRTSVAIRYSTGRSKAITFSSFSLMRKRSNFNRDIEESIIL